MQVRSFFIILLISLWLSQGCKYISEEKACISGTFTKLPETQLYIYQILPGSSPLLDSVYTDASGNFSISFPVSSAGYYSIQNNPDNEITLVVSPAEKIILNADGKSLRDTYTVKGSPETELYCEYNRFTATNLLKVDSLSGIFAESRANPDFISIKSRLDSAYLQIFNQQKAEVIAFVNRHPASLASLLAVSNNFGPNPLLSEQTQPELFLMLDSALSIAYAGNKLVNTFHLRMIDFKAELAESKSRNKLLSPGMPAPEIVLPNVSGKPVLLSSLKGKLTLVYFWSSWSAQCRQANIKLTGVYSRNHSHGFEIYAVSVDPDRELWQKAYMLDKAYWIQVNDPKGLASEYCRTYAVQAIPRMILVGKNGAIIARDPEFGELETLIKENL